MPYSLEFYGFVVGIICLLIAICIIFLKLGGYTEKFKQLNKTVESIPEKIDKSSEKICVEISKIPENILFPYLQLYMLSQKIKKNPSLDRKSELLLKLQAREIDYEECSELRGMLQEEASEAQANNDFLTLIVISGVLALIASILSALSK